MGYCALLFFKEESFTLYEWREDEREHRGILEFSEREPLIITAYCRLPLAMELVPLELVAFGGALEISFLIAPRRRLRIEDGGYSLIESGQPPTERVDGAAAEELARLAAAAKRVRLALECLGRSYRALHFSLAGVRGSGRTASLQELARWPQRS